MSKCQHLKFEWAVEVHMPVRVVELKLRCAYCHEVAKWGVLQVKPSGDTVLLPFTMESMANADEEPSVLLNTLRK